MPRFLIYCFLLGVGTLGLHTSSAYSQTQCPAGTTAGSYGCGPDSVAPEAPSVPTRWAITDGYGAYAYSSQSYRIYYFKLNTRNPEYASQRVLSNCAAEGNSDCTLLHSWKNSCAVMGFGRGPDTTDLLFAADARTKREATRKMEDKCAAKGMTCSVEEPFTHCVKRKAGWETYTPAAR